MVGELFGIGSFATVYGVQTLATQFAAGLGPLALGLAYAPLGGYQPGIRVLSLVAFAAAALLLTVRPPRVSKP